MLEKFALPLALLFAAAACAPADRAPTDAVQEEVAELWSDDTRTLLIGDAANALARQCSRVSPGPVEGAWTPSEEQLEALEDQLILLVARELENAGQTPSPGGYYRQYAGFIIGGRQIIYVNGVDEAGIDSDPGPAFHPGNWREHAIRICDGGTITFGAEYDPATQQISNFAFNGPY